MRVLLVDHDSEALEAITRAIRGVLELDCVTSKGDALLLLRQNTYDVLIACERCVDGSGLDLLGRTTRTSVPLKRIFAAAPERLQLLGPRLAPFKVQRTINYPIDLEELWLAIAQVTGTADDTDGTIERVVLDERGIPAIGTTPRAPVSAAPPPRAPSPLRSAPAPAPAPAPAVASVAINNAGRATARLTQPAPEPPLRPPVRRETPVQARAPAPPASTSDTGRMRAPLPPSTTSDTGRMRAPLPPSTTSDTGRMRAPLPPSTTSDTGRMRALAPPPPDPVEMTSWAAPSDDDFAAVAAQARLGVQRKVVDEAARRRKQRLIIAGVSAVMVAGAITFAIEKFYDPEARARERAIAAEVSRMSEEVKAKDNLAVIEVAIETAIMENELDVARGELARLVQLAPDHPRREFLQAAIDRAAELARLAAQNSTGADRAQARPAATERAPERIARTPERETRRETPARASDRPRDSRDGAGSAGSSARVFGAPIGEPIRPATIPLDAPINTPPTNATSPASPAATGSSFAGRTVEASDPPALPPSGIDAIRQAQEKAAGSAAVPVPPASTPAPVVPAPAPVEVVPAKLVKRVAPVVDYDVPRRASGHVVVSIEITETGRVGNVDVVESTPPGVFDRAALSAVRKWQYEPRKENGVAVASTARARIVFEAAN